MGLKDYSALRLGSRTIIAAYRGDLQVFGSGVGDPVAPTVSTPPAIAGTPRVGETLTATPGIYAGYPAPTVTRQWRRGTANISGATGLTYVPTAADIGRSITVRETAVNAAGSITSTSAAIGPVEAVSTAPLQIAGADWSVATGAAAREIILTLSELPSDGGSAITALQYQIDGGAWVALAGLEPGDHTLTMPAPATAYSVSVRAINAIGAGPASEPKSATSADTAWSITPTDAGATVLSAPSIPATPVIASVGDGMATIA